MSDCGCEPPPLETGRQAHALWAALGLNAAMFVVETGAGIRIDSTALVADGFDMLSDASVYSIALVAMNRGVRFKANAAMWSGLMLFVLGIGLLVEVVRRAFDGGSPSGGWMMAISAIALVVNICVLRLLSQQRNGEVHLRAAWIFTRADVIANAAVIASGLAVLLTGIRYFDLAVGTAIAAYVVREALEILRDARETKRAIV